MAQETPRIIGEGTYGCVHRPSLKCKNKPGISYKNKTSKLMNKKEANLELKEYTKVKRADPKNNYYLGVPENCNMDYELKSNIDAAKKCKLMQDLQLPSSQLIIMEDGGMNILQYAATMKKWNVNAESLRNSELFLLECLRMFDGIREFGKKKIVHHDLKPHNFVYNAEKNRLNIIDFGFMKSKKMILSRAAKNDYYTGTKMWFNFPWEIEYLQKDNFEILQKKPNQVANFAAKKKIIENQNSHEGGHIAFFLMYIMGDTNSENSHTNRPTKAIYLHLMQLYSLFFVEDIGDVDNPLSYNMFANKCVDTIDSYGLAFTLLFWLSNASKFLEFGGEKHKEFVWKFRACLYEMISPWLTARSSIDVSIVKFEQLLENSGILEKHHKKIVNHTIMDKDAHVAKKDKPVLVKLPKVSKKTRALDLFGEMDPPQCPEGKEMNPKTTRCVKVCKEGYARNEQFKCLKGRSQKKEKKEKKTVKISLNSKRSRCPNGSRKNPKTGNCEKY